MPIIGAHVSAAVSLDLSFDRALVIGASCTQIFISPPQQWMMTDHPSDEIKTYLDKKAKTQISPNFIHGTYLINLGTDNPEHLRKSIEWLKYALNMADKLSIKGVIFHTGSHKGRGFEATKGQVIESVKDILKQSPKEPCIILENCAGSGGVIGNFSEIGEIIRGVSDERVKVCIDTQHTFAQGYDLSKKAGVEKMIEDVENEIGWDRVVAVHCNDSKVELGSNRDRHENIGEGFIGKSGFKIMLNHPKFKDLPFILEVPGFSGSGPDKENIDMLKSLIDN